jgi:ATP-dependent Clp protease ATP-binding subunit ClpA
MFERFTEQGRQVIVLSQQEARDLGHGFIGTEHLLLGVLGSGVGLGSRILTEAGLDHDALLDEIVARVGRGTGGGIDGEALAAIGIDLDRVREAVEASFGPGALDRPRCGGAIPFTSRSKKALELSLREARTLGHGSIGTEHLVLGLAHDGLGAELLAERGLTLARLRELVRDAAAAA